MSSPFDYPHFRAAVFAAFVLRDWAAVGNALAILQDVTGTTLVPPSTPPSEVQDWAKHVCTLLQDDGDYLDEHGSAHPRLQCHNPACTTHGVAVRARLARGELAPLPRGRLVMGPPVPGVH